MPSPRPKPYKTAAKENNLTQEQRNEIVVKHLRACWWVVKRTQCKTMSYHDQEDLASFVAVLMVKAARLYDPDRGFTFLTYFKKVAFKSITREYKRLLRRGVGVPYWIDSTTSGKERYTNGEICIPHVKSISSGSADRGAARVGLTADQLPDHRTSNLLAVDGKDGVEDTELADYIRRILPTLCKRLTKVERRVIELAYLIKRPEDMPPIYGGNTERTRAMTDIEIASVIGCTRSYVHIIRRNALAKMRTAAGQFFS